MQIALRPSLFVLNRIPIGHSGVSHTSLLPFGSGLRGPNIPLGFRLLNYRALGNTDAAKFAIIPRQSLL